MSLCDALDLLACWRENPPTHIILAARYLDRKASRSRREVPDDAGPEADFRQLGGFFGPVQPMKPRNRELLDWAETSFKKSHA